MPTNIPVNEQAVFEFIDFFDWQPYGHVDLPLVRAKVATLPGKADIQGNLVIIEQMNCCFVFDEIKQSAH